MSYDQRYWLLLGVVTNKVKTDDELAKDVKNIPSWWDSEVSGIIT